MATSNTMATNTRRVRRCQLDGVRQERPGRGITPESAAKDQFLGSQALPAGTGVAWMCEGSMGPLSGLALRRSYADPVPLL